jgi:hypothetical protein
LETVTVLVQNSTKPTGEGLRHLERIQGAEGSDKGILCGVLGCMEVPQNGVGVAYCYVLKSTYEFFPSIGLTLLGPKYQ